MVPGAAGLPSFPFFSFFFFLFFVFVDITFDNFGKCEVLVLFTLNYLICPSTASTLFGGGGRGGRIQRLRALFFEDSFFLFLFFNFMMFDFDFMLGIINSFGEFEQMLLESRIFAFHSNDCVLKLI